MEADIAGIGELDPRHRQRLGRRVNAVQQPHARRHFLGPAPRAAAKVETGGLGGEPLKRKDVEIIVELIGEVFVRERFLVERRPFLAKAGDGIRIDITWLVPVGHALCLWRWGRPSPSVS